MTISESTTLPLVEHPIWCRNRPVSGPKLAPPENVTMGSGEHEGHDYHVTTEGCTYDIAVTPIQHFEVDSATALDGPRVRVLVRDFDAVGNDSLMYLSPAEVDRLIEILRRAQMDISLETLRG